MNSYRTITDEGPESFYTEKRSRFIGQAFPVENADMALQIVKEVRKRYNDARHVCWAYMLGTDTVPEERSNDDGEPSGSAGKPILGQIISRDLRNVIVTVVRYYGGVNLGTGGLAVAYKLTASQALDNSTVIEKTLYAYFRVTFNFALINTVMIWLKAHKCSVVQSDSDLEGHRWIIKVPLESMDAFVENGEKYYQVSFERIVSP